MAGLARMPRPVIAADKLNQLAASANEKMRRHFHIPQALKVGVLRMVKRVREKCLHMVTCVSAWRQTDGVYDHQIQLDAQRARPEIGRRDDPCKPVPPVLPERSVLHVLIFNRIAMSRTAVSSLRGRDRFFFREVQSAMGTTHHVLRLIS